MTPEQQLQLWVDGKPVHNPTTDDCTPDLSCCEPDLLQPKSVREAFQSAYLAQDSDIVYSFLSVFLSAFLDHKGATRNEVALPPGVRIRSH